MSNHRTHLIFYLALATGAYISLKEFQPGLEFGLRELSAVAVGAAYSILPDIDSGSSLIRRKMTAVLAAIMLAAAVYYLEPDMAWLMYVATAAATAILLMEYTRHRGAVHTLYAGIALSAPLLLVDSHYFLMAVVGYASHLALDGRLLR